MTEEQPTTEEIVEFLKWWRDKTFLGMYSYIWSTDDARKFNRLIEILNAEPDDVDKFKLVVNKVVRKPEELKKMDREERIRFVNAWNSMCLFIVNYGEEMRGLIESMEE